MTLSQRGVRRPWGHCLGLIQEGLLWNSGQSRCWAREGGHVEGDLG